MEIPKKIYVSPKVFNIGEYATKVLTTKYRDSIEYTRTDAFIEKAVSYIQQHWIWDTKMIENFKNYMKGE